jgi:hypothetical protein
VGNYLDVTTIGIPLTRTATRTVPLRAPAPATERSAAVVERPVELRPRAAAAPVGWVKVGTISLHRAASDLLVWAGVLFAVLLLVLVGGYLMLWALGVTASVSKALAIVLGEQVPSSGVLPILQPQSVLPLAVLASFVLSALALASAFAAVLVHNAVSSLTGGLLVRIRPADRPARVRHPRV